MVKLIEAHDIDSSKLQKINYSSSIIINLMNNDNIILAKNDNNIYLLSKKNFKFISLNYYKNNKILIEYNLYNIINLYRYWKRNNFKFYLINKFTYNYSLIKELF